MAKKIENTQDKIQAILATYTQTMDNVIETMEVAEEPAVKKLDSVDFIRLNLFKINHLETSVRSYYLEILDELEKNEVPWNEKTKHLQMVIFNGNGEREGGNYPLKKSGLPVGYDALRHNEKKDWSNEQAEMGLIVSRFVAWTGKYFTDYGVEKTEVKETPPENTGNTGNGEKGGKGGKGGNPKGFKKDEVKDALLKLSKVIENIDDFELLEAFKEVTVALNMEDIAV